MAQIIVLLREESSLALLENGTASVGGLQVGELGYNEASQEFSYKNRVAGAFRHITTREKMLLGAAAATSGAKGVGYFPAAGLTSVTVQDALDELRVQVAAAAGGGSGYILNGTSQQPTSNFNISGAGVIGTTLSVGGIVTLATALQRTASGEFLIQNTNASGSIKLGTTSGDVTLSPIGTLQLTPTVKVSVNNTADASSPSTGSLSTTGGLGIAKALWVGGLANIAGGVAVSGATGAGNIALSVGHTPLTGTSQYGIYSNTAFNVAATSRAACAYIKLSTTAAAYTLTSGYGIFIDTPVKGAGSTLSTNYGLFIDNQAGVGTTNYAIFSNGGLNYFVGDIFGEANVSSTTKIFSASQPTAVAGGLMAGKFGDGGAFCGIAWGSGAPTLTAPKGCLYLRTDGTTTNDRMYINTDAGTTWTAVTTAA